MRKIIISTIKAKLKEDGYDPRAFVFTLGGQSTIDITSAKATKADALLDYIKSKSLIARWVYYIGDEFFNRKGVVAMEAFTKADEEFGAKKLKSLLAGNFLEIVSESGVRIKSNRNKVKRPRELEGEKFNKIWDALQRRMGNDEPIAWHPELEDVNKLAVNVGDMEGAHPGTIQIGSSPQATADLLEAVLDPAMSTPDKGGIDLNAIQIKRSGEIMKIPVDPAQLNEFAQGGFEGFSPFISQISPVKDLDALLTF